MFRELREALKMGLVWLLAIGLRFEVVWELIGGLWCNRRRNCGRCQGSKPVTVVSLQGHLATHDEIDDGCFFYCLVVHDSPIRFLKIRFSSENFMKG